jgi:hypothetical protein
MLEAENKRPTIRVIVNRRSKNILCERLWLLHARQTKFIIIAIEGHRNLWMPLQTLGCYRPVILYNAIVYRLVDNKT